ncbi:MAG: DUF2922 domain-containing protein [Lactobacillus sp.]|jgi:hypothetical protein|nr:DUF2922 domain-containing protein [Lactobacillus sp.]
MKQLQMTFNNNEGKKTSLVLAEVKQDLDAETVKGAMQQLTDSQLFIKDGVALYAEVLGAKYVERIVTEVFEEPATV